jgi:hypothetical protein
MPARSIIRKTIEVNNHMFNLEIYPRLFSWEIFPQTYNAALYAFSNKDKLNKTIETNHLYEKRKK